MRSKDGLHDALNSRAHMFSVLPNAFGLDRLERGDELTNAVVYRGEFVG